MKVQTTRHDGACRELINSDRGLLCIVAQYAEKIRLLNPSRGAQTPQQLPQQGTNTQQPVGVAGMPSQTIHIPETVYQYVLRTKGEDQSTSGRMTDLIKKGRKYEESHE